MLLAQLAISACCSTLKPETPVQHYLMRIGFSFGSDTKGIDQAQLPGKVYAQGSIVDKVKFGFICQVSGFLQLYLVIQKHTASQILAHGNGEIIEKNGGTELHNIAIQIADIIERSALLGIGIGAIEHKEVLHKTGIDDKGVQLQGSTDGFFHRTEKLGKERGIDIGAYQLHSIVLQKTLLLFRGQILDILVVS